MNLILVLVLCLVFNTILVLCVQNLQNQFNYGINTVGKEALIWCTIGLEEMKKCTDWSEAIRLSRWNGFEFDLECKQSGDKDHCMNMIENGEAHVVTLDPGEIFVAGRYHSLIPIMYERYNAQKETGYYSVAVVKTESRDYIRDIRDLRGKKACFTGVGHMSGWVIPMARLLDEEYLLDIVDCNNIIKSAAKFFGDSCAPNSLIDKNNPLGNNPQSMCSLCGSSSGAARCSGSDPYANFEGAFLCLTRVGDIAFLKHTTVEQMTKRSTQSSFNKFQYELLCPNGVRRSIDSYQDCNWGFVPSHAIVISSATLPDKRLKIQQFLLESSNRFGSVRSQNEYFGSSRSQTVFRPINRFNQTISNAFNNYYDKTYTNISFQLFGDSPKYRAINLLFADETTELSSVDISKQTFSGYLSSYNLNRHSRQGHKDNNVTSYLDYFIKLRKCPVPNAKLCVISGKEVEKCNKMKTAFRAQMLKPELSCVTGHSAISCMDMINQGMADLAVLDAGDVYTGGHKYNLEPIVSEHYNLNDTYYYVVAIARQSDKSTDLLYLKGKRSCHTGIGMASGWVIPLSFLLTNSRMRSYECDSAKAASEFFQKSCVPGALSREFSEAENPWDFGNLCDLCHGASYRFCSRDSSEPFFGDTGALRCLVEGGGDIAFAKHTTILENTAGRNPQWWARNVIPDDFELLCRDGSRDVHSAYERCNLGTVSSNAIVTNKYKDKYHKEAYINLFLYAQQFYGSKFSEDFTFKMFMSEDGYHDLIFQDATHKLKAVPKYKRDYKIYLGHDFVKAMTIVDCTADAHSLSASVISTFFIITLFCIFSI